MDKIPFISLIIILFIYSFFHQTNALEPNLKNMYEPYMNLFDIDILLTSISP